MFFPFLKKCVCAKRRLPLGQIFGDFLFHWRGASIKNARLFEEKSK